MVGALEVYAEKSEEFPRTPVVHIQDTHIIEMKGLFQKVTRPRKSEKQKPSASKLENINYLIRGGFVFESLDLAVGASRIASKYSRQLLYANAKSLLIKPLNSYERDLGKEHDDNTEGLRQRALYYYNRGMYVKAEMAYQQLLGIYEKTLGLEGSHVVTSLNNLADVYREQGLYAKAQLLYQQAIAISEKSLGPDHRLTAISLGNLAVLYFHRGLYDQAESLYQRALKIREKAKDGNGPDIATYLNDLAEIAKAQGFYSKAMLLNQQALGIYEKTIGPQHPFFAIGLMNLGGLYSIQGYNSKAKSHYQQALGIYEKTLGPEHPLTGTLLNNIAMLYYKEGLYAKAEELFLHSLSISNKSLGMAHPNTASTLNNLALIYHEQGMYSKAAYLYSLSLAISEKALGPKHPSVAKFLANVASVLASLNLYTKPEQYYRRAISILEKALGPDHVDTANTLGLLANLYRDNGFYLKGEPLYKRAIVVYEKALGDVHPSLAIGLHNLALLYSNQRLYAKAVPLSLRALEIQFTLIQREVPYLVDSERRSHENSFSFSLLQEASFSFANRGTNGANLALFSRLNRQGLLEEIEKRQSQLSTLPGPQQEAAEQLRAINKQISSLSLSPQQRKALKNRQEELEAQLYRLLPELKPRIVDVQQVAAALPSTGALVEYQRYQPFDGKKPNDQRWGKPRYLALVLKANGSVTAIDLGPAAVIEERIKQALRATQEQLSDANQLWGQVGKQVLDPLAPALAGVQTLFVSPDGELNRIPFAALPAPGSKALLADALQLRLLTTGRELLDLAQPRSQAKTAALVVANPAFDQLASNAPVTAVRPVDPVESPFVTGGQQRSADLGSLRWSALPGTVKEGQAIAALTGATLLSGSQASATAIEKQAAPKILHIASHGYFLANQPTSPAGKRGLSDSGLSPMGALPAANLQGESPLLRSGIVLSGANQNSTATGISPGDRGDDGYLTALEITQLDWKGTELVVISACESGKGDIQAGEGVYGLKRAIAVAGARSSLLSLWKVDDAATAAFMQSFYEKLKTGQGRADALAATQKEFRNHSDPGWRHPYVWAAFQLSGDWGPIPGI